PRGIRGEELTVRFTGLSAGRELDFCNFTSTRGEIAPEWQAASAASALSPCGGKVMLAQGLLRLAFVYWTTWVAVGVGSTVAGMVYVTLRRYARRRRLAAFSSEEDLPWEDLLDLLRKRERELADSGTAPDKEL